MQPEKYVSFLVAYLDKICEESLTLCIIMVHIEPRQKEKM